VIVAFAAGASAPALLAPSDSVPRVKSSRCTHLLVSLPYPFGPAFEHCQVNAMLRLLWLLPITAAEAAFGRARGVDALEDLFERERIDTLDVMRASVV
jgi:hypothetical protein